MADFYFGSTTPDFAANYEVYGPTGSRPESFALTALSFSVPAGGITITELARGLNQNTAGGTVWIGVYNSADNSLIGSANVTIAGGGPDSYIWHSALGLNIVVSDTIASIYVVSAQPTVDVFGTSRAVTNGDVQRGANSQALADPFSSVSAFNKEPPIRVGYSLGGGGPSVVGSDVTDGQQATATTTGLTTYTAGTLGGAAISLSGTIPNLAYTQSWNNTIGSFLAARQGESVQLTVTGAEGVASTNVTTSPKVGDAFVTLSGTLLRDVRDLIPKVEAALGLSIVVGDQFLYPTDNFTSITAQGGYQTSRTGYVQMWLGKGGSATTPATWYPFQVQYTEGGGISVKANKIGISIKVGI